MTTRCGGRIDPAVVHVRRGEYSPVSVGDPPRVLEDAPARLRDPRARPPAPLLPTYVGGLGAYSEGKLDVWCERFAVATTRR